MCSFRGFIQKGKLLETSLFGAHKKTYFSIFWVLFVLFLSERTELISYISQVQSYDQSNVESRYHWRKLTFFQASIFLSPKDHTFVKHENIYFSQFSRFLLSDLAL